MQNAKKKKNVSFKKRRVRERTYENREAISI